MPIGLDTSYTRTTNPIVSEAPRTAGKIIPLAMVDFKKSVLGSKGPVIVEFMHPACPHCQATEPMLKQTAAKLSSKKFLQVDLSDPQNMAMAQRIGITGWPTFLFFQDGKNIGASQGTPKGADDLTSKVLSAYAADR